jgi:hypothetical protein
MKVIVAFKINIFELGTNVLWSMGAFWENMYFALILNVTIRLYKN